MERLLDHAAKGAGYGCNGLLAVHWRTSELVPEFAAMRAAAWDGATATAHSVYNEFCEAHFGEEVAAEMTEIFMGLDSFAAGVNLSATSYPATPTKLPRVSQSCCGKFGPCFDMPEGPSHGLCKVRFQSHNDGFHTKMMEFVLEMMGFTLRMKEFVLKMMNLILK